MKTNYHEGLTKLICGFLQDFLVFLPEGDKLAYGFVHVSDFAVTPLQFSTDSKQTPIGFPANPNLGHVFLRHTRNARVCQTIKKL